MIAQILNKESQAFETFNKQNQEEVLFKHLYKRLLVDRLKAQEMGRFNILSNLHLG